MPESPSPEQLKIESIVFWSIALFLFAGRLWSRAILKKGITKIQVDDYIMLATFCCYTTLLVLIQVSGHFGTNEMDTSLLPSVLANPKEIARREYGSKIVVGSNQCYLFTLWGVKACLLALYYNMTRLTSHNYFVTIVIVYVALGFIATELPLFILCRPFSQYWALPASNPQCSTYHTYTIVQTVFNISSDLLMLAIPIPPVLKAKTPKSTKALLVGIFSLGIFVILASVLNKYYNFTMPNTTVYMLWHIREASTSVMVANLMCWWPLLRKLLGFRREFLNRSSEASTHNAASRGTFNARGTELAWVDIESDGGNSPQKADVSLRRMESRQSAQVHVGQQVSSRREPEVLYGVAVQLDSYSEAPGKGRIGVRKSITVSQIVEKKDDYRV